MSWTIRFVLAATTLLVFGCDDGGPSDGDGDVDGDSDADGDVVDGDVEPDGDADDGGVDPMAAFEPYCRGEEWDSDLTAATVGELTGELQGIAGGTRPGTLWTMKVIPEHPFQVTTIRVGFDAAGPVRVRLMDTFGRSYPDIPSLVNMDGEDGDLMPPIEAEVSDAGWVEFDVSEHDIFLLPTQHYHLVGEQQDRGPFVYIESVPEGEGSRALLFYPGDVNAYGLDGGNFQMELEGSYFCAWEESEHWFSEDVSQPFADFNSSRAAFADLDGDHHDDLVIQSGGPMAFFGDGRGNFTEAAEDPFPDVPIAHNLVFADIDNDGDLDAFAGVNGGVDIDNDGDNVTLTEGDCDDTDHLISPRRSEVPGNGRDDDCDGVVDDGTDTSDADGDGHSIADGDCDDSRDDIYPGAEEPRDQRDNDCDGLIDEEHVNHIIENDGTGRFTVVADSGVEVLDQATAAGFGDADGDGNLDIYWGNWLVEYPEDWAVQDRYFEGRGDLTFTDAHEAAGLLLRVPYSVYGVMWNDYNNDGYQDIYVGNYHLYPNQLWQNQGDGTFVDVADEIGVAHDGVAELTPLLVGGHSYGGDFGDVDNDGDMDFYMANLAHPRVQPGSDPSMFVINSGAPDFVYENLREEYGFVYDEGDVNAAFADFDHDMDIDLAIASLYPNHYSRVYRNDGDHFTDITYETGTAVHEAVSIVWSDVDEDGDMDLVFTDRDRREIAVHLFINQVGQERNWIELILEGTTTNRGAIGARVTLEAGGVTQMRDVRGGGGHQVQNTRVVHFGLADETTIDDVTVRWVGGSTETISGLEPNGRYLVVEGSGTGSEL